MASRNKVALSALAVLAAATLYLLTWPVPVEPEAWEAPEAPAAEGVWAENQALAEVELLPLPTGEHGPEDLHELGDHVYTGTAGGHILRWARPEKAGDAVAPAEQVADTGGRPLGLHADEAGRLLIADADAGLLRLESDGSLTSLCTEAGGRPLRLADDLDVAADGSVWFTDASARFELERWKHDLLENRGNGRLLRWTADGGCEERLAGLHFANGVALAADDSFVLIVETSRYRVRRLWLTGPRSGEDEVFIDALPGFPDGISRGPDGHFWIALASPRNPIVDALAGRPFLRKALLRLPDFMQPAPLRQPYVIEVDEQGQVLRTLQDLQGRRFGVTTSVQPCGDRLYLGSLSEPAAAWLELD